MLRLVHSFGKSDTCMTVLCQKKLPLNGSFENRGCTFHLNAFTELMNLSVIFKSSFWNNRLKNAKLHFCTSSLLCCAVVILWKANPATSGVLDCACVLSRVLAEVSPLTGCPVRQSSVRRHRDDG